MSRALRKKSLASALVLLACAGQSLDVGNDPKGEDGVGLPGDGTGGIAGVMSTGAQPSGGGSVGVQPSGGGTFGAAQPPSTPSVEPPSQTGCDTDPAYQDFVGTWQGQLEDFYLKRIKALTLVINGVSSSGMCGSLKWGDGEAPAPATDAAGPYPPTAVYDVMGYGGSPGYTPLDGFTYTIEQGAVRDRTLRLSIGTNELWQSWCELQTSFHYQGGYNCVPDSDTGYGFGSEPGGTCMAGNRTFSNFTCYMCLASVCACTEEGCAANSSYDELDIGLTLSEDRKVLTGPADDRATGYYAEKGAAYYLERVP